MKNIVILGGVGVGMIAASIIDSSQDARVIGFLNNSVPQGSTIGKYRKIPVLGRIDDVHEFLQDSDMLAYAAFQGITDAKKSYEFLLSLRIPQDKLYSPIHGTAVVSREYCGVGQGVMLGPLCQVSPDATISDHCIMFGNSFLGHDSYMDEFSHLATNSVVSADVRIGKGVHIGANATVRERVHLGDFSLVGAGAVVVKDVPANTIVVGNPARVLKERGQLDYLVSQPRVAIREN